MSFADTMARLFGHVCPGMSHYDRKVIEFAFALNKPNRPMLVGDSITEAWSTTNIMHPFVTNYGISGDTTVGVLNRINQIINAKPNVIFLNIGINDLQFGLGNTLIERYTQIITLLKLNKIEVYCCAIRPVNNFMPQGNRVFNDFIININEAISCKAKENGCIYVPETFNIHFNDAFRQMYSTHSTDGLHLSPLGYEEEYKVLWPFIEKYIYTYA